MKIIFTGDNHIFYHDQTKNISNLMDSIIKEKPDIVCNLGDIGEVLIEKNSNRFEPLFQIQPTLFVLGNHDLYSCEKFDPCKSFDEALKILKYGIPLQTTWNDKTTKYEIDKYLFLGTIGFPDFSFPNLIFPKEYYDKRSGTVDNHYIDLSNGWLFYTNQLIDAFKEKLKIINDSNCDKVIIITHYPIFESQHHVDCTSMISPYFFCYQISQLILEIANQNLQKHFYCIAAHGHNYNTGTTIEYTSNITTIGFIADYNQQNYITLTI